MTAAGPRLCVLLAAGALPFAGCGDSRDGSANRGAGALGGGARVETLARTELRQPSMEPVAWVGDELRLRPREELEHSHELAFAYARRGTGSLETGDESEVREAGGAAVVTAGETHVHRAGPRGLLLWEFRLTPAGSRSRPPVRRLFESEPLEGVPHPATVSFLRVTLPPRGGSTTVHTHPGPELIYQLTGRIDYENALIGTKRLGPGGLEGIPPDTPVQKRNPYRGPATFLSWFVVDPSKPFAPRAEF